jgi:YHS domain-containing protein/thioredoxin-related protein
MGKQILTNIYGGVSCVDLSSKIVAVTVNFVAVRLCRCGIFLVAVMLLSMCQQLSAQMAEPIKWSNDINKACQAARLENRLVLVHFCSDCAPCVSMDANVFTDPRIAIEMNRNFIAVRADMKTQMLLAQQYGVMVVPTDLILKPDGQVFRRRQGEIAADKYLQFLQYLRNDYFQSQHSNAATTPNNNMIANSATNNPNTAVPAEQVLPNSATAQLERNNLPNAEPQGNFSFITGNDQPSQPSFVPNSPNVTPDQQNVISASGRIDPNEANNANVVAVQPVGVGGMPPHVAPFAAPIGSDKNVVPSGGVVDVNGVALNNVKNNPTNNVSMSMVSGANTNSATNNPMMLRNSFAVNQASIGNVDSAGHLMVEVPLAIEGYCPVVLCKKEEWTPGNPAYYAMYRGQVYRFSGQEAMEEFLKTPLKFAPVAMGEDVVMMIDRNKKVCGLRKYGVWFGGRVYLFASKESLNNFIAKPEYYANIAQNYEAAFKSPLDTVQR